MKIEDLMIGDWVMLNYDISYKTGESLYTNVRITGINEDGTINVSMHDGDSWNSDLIYSIPITKELLEKNGFETHQSGVRMFLAHDDYRLCYYLNSSNRFTSFNNIDGSLVQKVIVNVHELQHALKLCGINKEIVV